MARLLATKPYNDVAPIFTVPPGQYKNLFLFFDGVSATSQTALITDTGIVTASKNGIPFIASVKFENLQHIANMRGGQVLFTSGSATTTRYLAPLMFWDASAPDNGLLVTENDLVTIQIALATGWTTHVNTTGGSGTWFLYGDDSDCVQNYLPILTQFGYASVTNLKDRLQVQNVSRLFVDMAADSNLQKIQVIVDKKLLHDLTASAMLAISNFNNQLEDATQLATSHITNAMFAELPLAVNGRIGEYLNDSVEIAVQATTATSPNIITLGYMFTPDAQVQSMAKVQQSAVDSLKKQPTATAQVIRTLISKNQAHDALTAAGV